MEVMKVTLGSKKVVLLRPLQIKHQDLAAQAASARVGNTGDTALGIAMQKELLKLLIVQVDGQAMKQSQLEDLDSVFSFSEYIQLCQVLQKIIGDQNEMGNFQIEFASSGET